MVPVQRFQASKKSIQSTIFYRRDRLRKLSLKVAYRYDELHAPVFDRPCESLQDRNATGNLAGGTLWRWN
jgi:hypothetical protein